MNAITRFFGCDFKTLVRVVLLVWWLMSVLSLWVHGIVIAATPYWAVPQHTMIVAVIATAAALLTGIGCFVASKRTAHPVSTSLRRIAFQHLIAFALFAMGTWDIWSYLHRGLPAHYTDLADSMRAGTAGFFVGGYLVATMIHRPLATLFWARIYCFLLEIGVPIDAIAPEPAEENGYRTFTIDLLERLPPEEKLEATLRFAALTFDDMRREPALERRTAQADSVVAMLHRVPSDQMLDGLLGVTQQALRKIPRHRAVEFRRILTEDPDFRSNPCLQEVLNLIDGHLALNQILTSDSEDAATDRL